MLSTRLLSGSLLRMLTICATAALSLCVFCGEALAEDAAAGVSPVEIKDVAAINSGDTAWMLTSSAQVLMMTGPALALFYGGLVRRKNVLATMMQSFILMAVVSIVWAVLGYSLAFDAGNPFFGGLHFAFLKN